MSMFRVLIVEDEPEVSQKLHDVLSERLGASNLQGEVVRVFNMIAAHEQLGFNRFNVVSIDARFPNDPGGPKELGMGNRLIDQLEALNHTGPVIFCSGEYAEVTRALKKTVSGHAVVAIPKDVGYPEKWAEACIKLLRG